MDNMFDIFLSFRGEVDENGINWIRKSVIEPLHKILTTEGWRTFIDSESIKNLARNSLEAVPWDEAIVKSICFTRGLAVFLITESYLRTHWPLYELKCFYELISSNPNFVKPLVLVWNSDTEDKVQNFIEDAAIEHLCPRLKNYQLYSLQTGYGVENVKDALEEITTNIKEFTESMLKGHTVLDAYRELIDKVWVIIADQIREKEEADFDKGALYNKFYPPNPSNLDEFHKWVQNREGSERIKDLIRYFKIKWVERPIVSAQERWFHQVSLFLDNVATQNEELEILAESLSELLCPDNNDNANDITIIDQTNEEKNVIFPNFFINEQAAKMKIPAETINFNLSAFYKCIYLANDTDQLQIGIDKYRSSINQLFFGVNALHIAALTMRVEIINWVKNCEELQVSVDTVDDNLKYPLDYALYAYRFNDNNGDDLPSVVGELVDEHTLAGVERSIWDAGLDISDQASILNLLVQEFPEEIGEIISANSINEELFLEAYHEDYKDLMKSMHKIGDVRSFVEQIISDEAPEINPSLLKLIKSEEREQLLIEILEILPDEDREVFARNVLDETCLDISEYI